MTDTLTADFRTPRFRTSRARVVLPWLAAVLVVAALLVVDAFGLLAGIPAVALAVGLWIAIPSSNRLSRRLAINGAVALGVVPVLWWLPWPATIAVSHSAILLGLGAGAVVYLAFASARSRRSLIPSFTVADLLPLGAALVTAWFFRPFFALGSGPNAFTMLRGAFGNDNVAHFDMFDMIRRNLVSGMGWPKPDDGSLFAYVPYPQHFHSFAVFAAELWAGAGIDSVDGEIRLYGIGTSLTIAFCFVTLIAAVVGLRALRSRWVISGVVAAAAFSFVLLGFGSTALSYGFPPYLFAILATLVGVVIAMDSGVAKNAEVFALGASAIAVAHSWSLLTPVVGTAVVLMATRLPWSAYRARWRTAIPTFLIALFTATGVGFALYLVVAATSPVGAPDEVLSTGGAIPTTSVSVTLALGAGVFALALLALSRIGAVRPWTGGSNAFVVLGGVAAVATAEALALILVQLGRTGALEYFQYKFLNAIYLILAVLLVLGVALAIAREPSPTTRFSRVGAVAGGASLAFALVITSGLPVAIQPFPGLQFRDNVYAHSLDATESDQRVIAAATVMATWPCERPIYLAPQADDPRMEESNQWAMSLSATWTENAAPINTYLVSRFSESPIDDIDSTVSSLLDGDDGRCVIVEPKAMDAIGAEVRSGYGSRIISW